MEPQFNVPVQSLTKEIQVLFDAAHPIPRDVWFQPRHTDTSTFIMNLIVFGFIVGGAFAGSGIVGLAALTVSLLSGTYRISDLGDAIIHIAIDLVLIGLLVTGWRVFWTPLWVEWLALREQRAGILRRGLFLTPDAMIIRLQINYCDILPRNSILDVVYLGFRVHTGYVRYRRSNGKQKSYALSFPPFQGLAYASWDASRIQDRVGTREKTSENR